MKATCVGPRLGIVDEVQAKGACDFVTEVASRLLFAVICDMMGIPAGEEAAVAGHSSIILSQGDPEFIPEGVDIPTALLGAGQALAELVQDLGEFRKRQPTDDLTSALVNANVDGEHLSDQELASFFILLVVAGNETTRNAISHGLKVLTDNRDQRRLWLEDFDGRAPAAVEEIVRWASPVIWMRRTATATRPSAASSSTKGTRCCSSTTANQDEAAFMSQPLDVLATEPARRSWAGRSAFLPGAHLARREITVMFRGLFSRLPDIEATGEPEMLQSSFINGIKHLDAAFTPAG